jgi:phosphonate transport system ATP-binding protein
MLSIQNLGKVFDDGTEALKNVNLKIGRGEFVVILGPSGSGKTTLLRTIIGLTKPTSGELYLESKRIATENNAEIRKNVGMIFQDFRLIENLSVLNNVLTGLLEQNRTFRSLFYLFPTAHKLRALECIDQVGLISKSYTRTRNLSGGQQQRVGIARAIAKNPLLLLADEPVASLDPMIAFGVLSLLKEICTNHGITVVCNLHQVDFALRFADRIVGLSGGRKVIDKPIDEVDENFIHKIYQNNEQGLFFGPNTGQAQGTIQYTV